MAHIRQRKSGTFEITIKHASLPRPISASADTEEAARAWAKKIEAQIKAGTLPQEYLIEKPKTLYTIQGFIGEVIHSGHFSASDKPLLKIISTEIGNWHLAEIVTVHGLTSWGHDGHHLHYEKAFIQSRAYL